MFFLDVCLQLNCYTFPGNFIIQMISHNPNKIKKHSTIREVKGKSCIKSFRISVNVRRRQFAWQRERSFTSYKLPLRKKKKRIETSLRFNSRYIRWQMYEAPWRCRRVRYTQSAGLPIVTWFWKASSFYRGRRLTVRERETERKGMGIYYTSTAMIDIGSVVVHMPWGFWVLQCVVVYI